MTETPFKISISDAAIERLQQKLNLASLPDELEGSGWDYGVPLADLKRLLSRWRDGYDWRRNEAQINAALPQFTRPISVDGHGTLEIHYVHQQSEVSGAIPLLFVHGWPGSFIEARKIVSLLTAKSADHPSFHVVVLGLPGYGFSEGPSTKGFNLPQYAEVGHKLMLALGYNEYVTQGGDWGHAITRTIALLYGEKHSKAWHTNTVPGKPPADNSTEGLTAKEKAGLAHTKWFTSKGRGYACEQATQPQTLGYALADSPVGLLAWLYEKTLLTWVSIYLFSRAGPAASLRIYFETSKGDMNATIVFCIIDAQPPTIPLGLSYFPKDIVVMPKSWARGNGNIVFESEHDSGGHFGAYEKPNELADDVRRMFGKGGPAFGVVPGKSGYE
ncbi:Alpha/Beta hydrolase protein [Mycena crocata]|nr:Alpha/Beta hydrolase protein [Mycena crocata]